jgi:putative acetyltransferase
VVLGDPSYYGRFGFRSVPGLRFGNFPEQGMQALAFSGEPPRGEVVYHASFGVG